MASKLVTAPAVGLDGSVYVSSTSIGVFGFSKSGSVLWFSSLSASSSVALNADAGTVYAGASDLNVYSIDVTAGQTMWKYHTTSIVYGPPTIGVDGRIYFGCDNGNVSLSY